MTADHAALIREIEERTASVHPTGKGEQHCDLCGRMSYVGDDEEQQHDTTCVYFLLRRCLALLSQPENCLHRVGCPLAPSTFSSMPTMCVHCGNSDSGDEGATPV